jgi:hypothetical protein
MLIGICSTAILGHEIIRRKQVYEYTREKDGCCKVLNVSDLYTWKLGKKDGPFVANFCQDYDLTAYNPTPGLLMKKLRYKDMGTCWSIERKDLGIWWQRDSNNRVIAEKENN